MVGMKVTGTFVASIVAASTAALSCSGDRDVAAYSYASQGPSSSGKDGLKGSVKSSDQGKFAPRFDGLRFIETLVTAHR